MSTLSTNKIIPATSTTVTLGDSGDTFALASGASATGFGKVLQVLQTTKTDTATSTNTSYTDISGLSQAITPSATNSKVLVIVNVNMSQATANSSIRWQIVRDSTAIAIGDADGSRTRATSNCNNGVGDESNSMTMMWLDSPSSTSALTYKVQWIVGNGTAQLNKTDDDSDAAAYARMASNIIVQEIGA